MNIRKLTQRSGRSWRSNQKFFKSAREGTRNTLSRMMGKNSAAQIYNRHPGKKATCMATIPNLHHLNTRKVGMDLRGHNLPSRLRGLRNQAHLHLKFLEGLFSQTHKISGKRDQRVAREQDSLMKLMTSKELVLFRVILIIMT
jgi:hypothetical protein